MPRLAFPAKPRLATPSVAFPAVPCRTQPCHATPATPCPAQPGLAPPRHRPLYNTRLVLPNLGCRRRVRHRGRLPRNLRTDRDSAGFVAATGFAVGGAVAIIAAAAGAYVSPDSGRSFTDGGHAPRVSPRRCGVAEERPGQPMWHRCRGCAGRRYPVFGRYGAPNTRRSTTTGRQPPVSGRYGG